MNRSVLASFLDISASNPDRVLFTEVDHRGQDIGQLTYGQARQSASAIARFLRVRCGLAVGDRAVLVYPPGLDFVRGLLGALLAGVIPVPVAPPNPFSPEP